VSATDGAASSWRRDALEPPRALGPLLPQARLRTEAGDFLVEEELSFAPSGSGAHWLLSVEKRNANTRWVAAQLALRAGVRVDAVGYAGLKDRRAVTRQWFSVPAATGADYWRAVQTTEFKVLDVQGNARKLKRGALSGNRFKIRLREAIWPAGQLEEKLALLKSRGVPNYFGPQRFGRGGGNLDRVDDWAVSGRPPRGRESRAFALSAARSLLFNRLLARRVAAGDWDQLAVGDVASLDGSGSHFLVTAMDDDLRRRCRTLDIHPSGPLWGQGDPASSGASLRLEREAAGSLSAVAELLEHEGLRQERRALRSRVRELACEQEAGSVTLSFVLGRGQFATAVLREICELTVLDASALEEDEGEK
jgi:tRNA pseudouridine13 synthase